MKISHQNEVKSLQFFKYSGCGNDFIIIDNRVPIVQDWTASRVSSLCERHEGVGADGVILLENTQSSDYKMRIFNADGSEAEMCGNGIRCLGRFLQNHGESHQQVTIEVMGFRYPLTLDPESITVEMIPPSEVHWNLEIPLGKKTYTCNFLNTGVPHAVISVDDISTIDVSPLGKQIRHHPLFQPQGANVNFIHRAQDDTIHIRTYERGVEQETLACGTGAAAAAISAVKMYHLKSPVTVVTRSGEALIFRIDFEGDKVNKLSMKGPAREIFKGEITIVEEKMLNGTNSYDKMFLNL